MDVYNVGLDALADWASETYNWLLLKSGSFDADADTVAGVLGTADEVTVSGYARVAASTKARTVNDTSNRISYTAANPNWGTLSAGETVTAALLVRLVTTDADSIPVGWATLDPTATEALDPFTITIVGGVVAYIDQAV